MKKLVLFSIIASTAGLAAAQEQGRVLSATPIVQQVAYPRQVCTNETVYSGQNTTGGGAVLGAIAGGAAGNAIGKGSGRSTCAGSVRRNGWPASSGLGARRLNISPW